MFVKRESFYLNGRCYCRKAIVVIPSLFIPWLKNTITMRDPGWSDVDRQWFEKGDIPF